jgi:hypothetical protein
MTRSQKIFGGVLALAWSCTAPETPGRELAPLIAGELGLRAKYAQQYPCPSPAPLGLPARTVPRGDDWECSAVVATMAAFIREAQRPGYLQEWRRVPVRCIKVFPMRFPELRRDGTFGPLEGFWSVEFWNAVGQGARGIVQVPSGALEVYPLDNEFGMSLDEHCSG